MSEGQKTLSAKSDADAFINEQYNRTSANAPGLTGKPRSSPVTWGETYEHKLAVMREERTYAVEYLDSIRPEYERASQVVTDLYRAINALENG